MLLDPGSAPWEPVPRDQIAEVCLLDPDLLDDASESHGLAWAVVRFGRLCYEGGDDQQTEIYSATKTLGATVIGALIHQSRDIPKTGPGTGPLSDADLVSDWMAAPGSFDLNPDAEIAHILAMVAYNSDLGYGNKIFSYDAGGTRELDALNSVASAVMAQDPARLGDDLEQFFQKFLAEPLGFENSTWTDGEATKRFAITWNATVRDMARLGLLLLNHGTWSGERLISEEYVYRMTHPAFEDGNTAYGYLTWLSSRSNSRSAYSTGLSQMTTAQCSPAALWPNYPHERSGAPDCNYTQGGCEQTFDAGVWFAAGLNGQYIQGHPGLDMVVISKEAGNQDSAESVAWNAMRPALVALDPKFMGDEDAFCAAYANNEYAPYLHTGWTP
jgi:hypothetical protein